MIGSPIQHSHVKVSWFNMLLTLDQIVILILILSQFGHWLDLS